MPGSNTAAKVSPKKQYSAPAVSSVGSLSKTSPDPAIEAIRQRTMERLQEEALKENARRDEVDKAHAEALKENARRDQNAKSSAARSAGSGSPSGAGSGVGAQSSSASGSASEGSGSLSGAGSGSSGSRAATLFSGGSSTGSGTVTFFAIVCLILHLIDALFLFSTDASHRSIMLVLYVGLTIFALMLFSKRGAGWKRTMTFIGLSLLAWALPYLKYFNFLGRSDYFTVALFFLPVWFIYVGFHSQNRWLRRAAWFPIWLLIIMLLLIILSIVINRNLIPDVGSVPSDVWGAITRVFREAWDALGVIWSAIVGRINPGRIRQQINQTFNPSAYYVGQVEQNKAEPHGVYITSLESLYPVTYVGTEPALLGRIEAKTFVPGGTDIEPSCRLERGGHGVALGYPDVETIPVDYQMARDITCTFDGQTNLTPGTYYGVLGAEFPFQTWAYVTFTFVSRNAIINYQAQGKDINAELDIDPMTPVIYTNGPVSLGISASRQPIDIDLSSSTGQFIQQRFGFTLENRWTQGELEDVSQVRILVPRPFSLVPDSCLPTTWTSGPELVEDNMLQYTFAKGLDMDAHHDYRTVTCKLTLDREGADEVLAFGLKTPVTFAVIADYRYKIEKKTPVRVGG